MNARKVFGIGFHKTGTKSFKAALRRLGYSVTGPNGVHDRDIATTAWEMSKELISRFDAFQDNPWPILFRELYSYRPDDRFVLTIRPTEGWIQSIVGHFGRGTTPMREWIYGVGSPRGNETCYVERYDRHNREVLEFFADKPSSLIVMNFAAGDGWEKLCAFLEKPVPAVPFPHVNSRTGTRHVGHAPELRPS